MSDEGDRRSQIVRAAFEEFASKGFRGATIKSIAQAAGLQSPALIYWYFPTKEALFQAVLEDHAPIVRAVVDPADLMDWPPEEVLPLLARTYLAMAHDPNLQRLVRLVIAEAVQRSDLADAIMAAGPGRVLRFLSAYLARQIELGRLRPHHTHAGARAFIGMLLPQAIAHGLFPTLGVDGPTDEEHVVTAIDVFLCGLRAGESGQTRA